jgi:ATP-dependent exoDNAse (exonuclease V) alpha subunit
MHPFVAEYNNALERRAKFAKMCLDAGVSERQIALAERMGEQLSMLWERTMNAIDGLTEAQRLQAAKAYAREIALLERPVIDGAARDVA